MTATHSGFQPPPAPPGSAAPMPPAVDEVRPGAETPVGLRKNLSYRFGNWFVNEGPKAFFLVIWTAVNLALFLDRFFFFRNSASWSNMRDIIGDGLPWARGSAQVLNFNCGIILLTVCRNLITYVRRIPGIRRLVDKHITFHRAVAWTIAFATYVHVGAHYFNFLHIEQATPEARKRALLPDEGTALQVAVSAVAGWTGHLLVLVMFVMYTAAVEGVRRKYFELFWFSHHLFVVFFVLLLGHGAQCLLRPQNAGAGYICIPATWKWVLLSLVVYLLERMIREIRARRTTTIAKVIQHPSRVVEIQMNKPSMTYRSGQYLFLNCPDISRFEWHPFTISSAPEEGHVSCHIRLAGDWTTAFARRLGCTFDGAPGNNGLTLPQVYIDGPFGAASEDVFKYDVAVLIGAGIGVTPFSSVLKSIWYRVVSPNTKVKLKKCYFFWICRDTGAFEWFHDLLRALEAEDIGNFLEIHIYLTGGLKLDQVKNIMVNDRAGLEDGLTGLKSPTRYGRPDWDTIFGNMGVQHPDTEIGVFFCGPKPLSSALHIACNNATSSKKGGAKFYYQKENF